MSDIVSLGLYVQQFRLEFAACLQKLSDGAYLASAPAFPEVSSAGDRAQSCLMRLKRGVLATARGMEPPELFRRQSMGRPELRRKTVDIAPPARGSAWETPLQVSVPIARWAHGVEAYIAWVPSLNMQVLARSHDDREAMLESEIRSALLRTPGGLNLQTLARLHLNAPARIIQMTVSVPLHSARQRAQQAEREAEVARRAVLKQVATDLETSVSDGAHARDPLIREIAAVLTGRPPRSVLLVGQSGVGKTALVRELARRKQEFGLSNARIVATSGAQLIAGMSGFGMWQDRCRQVCEAAERSGAILHLGSLWELSEVGRGGGGGVGIASFLQPYLLRGKLLAVAECLPEQFALLERSEPKLLQPFETLRIDEPSPGEFRQILELVASSTYQPGAPTQSSAPLSSSALEAIERLHQRYASVSAKPGRAVRFIRNLIQDSWTTRLKRAEASGLPMEDGPLGEADVNTAFARETGLPLFLLDDRIRFQMDDVRLALCGRVKGQPEAVEQLVRLLAIVKARVARPGKPLASLLFIGPTGVGKTELARTLAAFLFGDESRLTRFDMSEFGDSVAARRLVGVSGSEGQLTSKVREQPFSVVLLDEFEKADPSVFDLLLQVLGEGRLTDGAGRLADFTNAVIVCTSNLGAEGFQQGAAGFQRDRGPMHDHFVEAVRRFLRPELFNRFDAIVPFAPLDTQTLREIAAAELAQLRRRDGLRFRVADWSCPPEVTEWLTQRGYDPVYGARPLKRAIERELLAPLAQRMNDLPPEVLLRVQAVIRNNALSVEVRADSAVRVQTPRNAAGASDSAQRALEITRLRRQTGLLLRSAALRQIRNDAAQLKHAQQRERKRMHRFQSQGRAWKPPPGFIENASRLDSWERILNAADALQLSINQLEDQAWRAELLEVPPPIDWAAAAIERERCDAEWWKLLLTLYSRQFPTPDRALLAIFCEHRPTLEWLLAGYRGVARLRNWSTRTWELSPVRTTPDWIATKQDVDDDPLYYRILDDAPQSRRSIGDPVAPAKTAGPELQGLTEESVGVLLQAEGDQAFVQLHTEPGLHTVAPSSEVHEALLMVTDGTVQTFEPPEGIARQGAVSRLGERKRRRAYDLSIGRLDDADLKDVRAIQKHTLAASLDGLLRDRMWRDASALLEAHDD